MKKRFGFVLVFVLLSSLLLSPAVQAAHTDAFTFFIPWPASVPSPAGELNDLAEFFAAGNQISLPGVAFGITTIEYTISISVLRDGGLIYYDHWEDGLEDNPNFPVQDSTEIWGDGDLTNGVPPDDGIPPDPDFPTDQLQGEQVITLKNEVPIPYNPSPGQATYPFDGGDKIRAVDTALAVSLAAWPLPYGNVGGIAAGGIRFADAWELYPTSRWGHEYVIPVGENVDRPGNGFDIVAFNVLSSEDGNTVEIDLLGDGTFVPIPVNGGVLDEGDSYMVVQGVQAGAGVRASEPVQVQLFAKDPNSNWQARGYTMLQTEEWGSEYLAPRSSDGDFWLYNPHDSELSVTVETITQTTSITIPMKSFGRYPPLPASLISAPTGVYFRSDDGREFYGIAALDADQVQDWGYALLPIENLTTQTLVGWAPGNNEPLPASWPDDLGRRASRVYVTAPEDLTLTVEFQNGSGTVRQIPIPRLEEVNIVDDANGTNDFNMTGARLYTTDPIPFIAVWGQDPSAPGANPSIDVGTNIVPLRAPSIQKTFDVMSEGYECGVVQQPHQLRFELTAFNESALPVTDSVVTDNLMQGIEYVPGSTTVNGGQIQDDAQGSPFPLDDPGYTIDQIEPFGAATLSYEARIAVGGTYINRATLSNADPAALRLSVPVRTAGLEIGKTLVNPPADGEADPGEVLTFTVQVTNTRAVPLAQIPLRDEYETNFLTFVGASAAPDDLTPGRLGWTDLTGGGDLAPGAVLPLTLAFRVVDTLPVTASTTVNKILSEGAQSTTGAPQAVACGSAQVSFGPTPTPTFTPTSTPTIETRTVTPTFTRTPGNGDDDGTVTATWTPPPPPPPGTPPPPPVTSTPAVVLLPETGLDQPAGGPPAWLWLVLPGLALVAGWAVYRRTKE